MDLFNSIHVRHPKLDFLDRCLTFFVKPRHRMMAIAGAVGTIGLGTYFYMNSKEHHLAKEKPVSLLSDGVPTNTIITKPVVNYKKLNTKSNDS